VPEQCPDGALEGANFDAPEHLAGTARVVDRPKGFFMTRRQRGRARRKPRWTSSADDIAKALEPNAEISSRKEVIGKMKSTNNVLTLSDAELSSFTAQIEHIATILSEGFEPLEPKQAMRLVKLSGRRLKAVPEITKLAGTYGIKSPSAPVADISANLASATKLRVVLASVDALRDVLAGHALATEANAWKGASTLYGVLQGEAKGNPVLKKALAPVRDQLRVNRKATTKETDTAGTAAETTSNATTTATNAAAAQTATVHATTAG
jgi:hypothetical protein